MWNRISKHHKNSKNFFKYFSNNKKQKNIIGPLHEEGDIITTDIKIAEILNNNFIVFTPENFSNIPEFNLIIGTTSQM